MNSHGLRGRTFEPVDDVSMMQSPHLWPEYPFLRVDRRTEPRQGQGTCFVRTNEVGEVEPVVYVTASWPPAEDDDPLVVVSFGFQDFEGLLGQGWKVVHLIT